MEHRPKIRYWIPAASVDEKDLRQEIRALCDRGFGGIEVVVLQMVPASILQSDDGWGTEHWNHVVEILNEETSKLGMTLDLAAGPGWPLASPALLFADAPGALTELTYGYQFVRGGDVWCGPLPGRRVQHDEGTPKRIAAMAYRADTSDPEIAQKAGTKEKTSFGEREIRQPLIADSYICLDDKIRIGSDGREEMKWKAPGGTEETWVVLAFWEQPAVQKINGGQTYVIDHLSKAGAKAMADYWEPVLESHQYDAMESLFCDSLEYEVALDWTPGLLQAFRERRNYDLIPFLPFLGTLQLFPAGDVPAWNSVPGSIREQVNNDFSEVLTQLYCENHLNGLEKMAERFGKTIRYQVAYNKPFEEERCGLYVGIPENEALGRAQLDGQRLMAAAAHLGRKKRYSFECAAEFGHNYGQSYEDLFWWVKRSLMSGMNAQVLHGGSYSGKCSGSHPGNELDTMIQWPGYMGFGTFVSNDWNRTPDLIHARGCLDAIARLNAVFRNKARVDCAMFRQSYCNDGLGAEHMNYCDNGLLENAGYSYEFLSEFLLSLPEADVKEGQIDPCGVGYRVLIVPPQERMSGTAMGRILELSEKGLPVILAGPAPKEPMYYSEVRTESGRGAWEGMRDRLWSSPAANVMHAADLSDVPLVLASCDILPRAGVSGGTNLVTAVREDTDQNRCWTAIYKYDPIEFAASVDPRGIPASIRPAYRRPGAVSAQRIQVTLHGCGRVWRYDYWTNTFREEKFSYTGNDRMVGTVMIEEDELIILCVDGNEQPPVMIPTEQPELPGQTNRPEQANQKEQAECTEQPAGTVRFDSLQLQAFGPFVPGETSFLCSQFSEETAYKTIFSEGEPVKAWKDLDPSLQAFSGRGIYEGILQIDRLPGEGERLILRLGDVCDTFIVAVNGEKAPFPDQVKKESDLTGLVHAGENRLRIEVVSELYNAVLGAAGNQNMADPMQFKPHSYGIIPTAEKPVEVVLVK